MQELILGGARSGKSRLAERLAGESGLEVIYIATSQALDGEMSERIRAHRDRRPAHWALVEEPLQLGRVLSEQASAQRCLLVDCLTLWLSNLMFSTHMDYPDVGPIDLTPLFTTERAALLALLEAPAAGDIIFVSNEVGMGIVPYGAVSRAYTDEAGRLNQDVAARCDRVLFVAAGLPLALKGAPC